MGGDLCIALMQDACPYCKQVLSGFSLLFDDIRYTPEQQRRAAEILREGIQSGPGAVGLESCWTALDIFDLLGK